MTRKQHARRPRLGLCACVALVALLIAATPAGATETRTIGLTAQVNSTHSFFAPVCGGVAVGDIITGSYTYTLGTPARFRSTTFARYDWSAPTNGITLNVVTAVVQTDYNAGPPPGPFPPPGIPVFSIGLEDNFLPFEGATPTDGYNLQSNANQGCPGFTTIEIRLEDLTAGRALTNTSLPTKALNLADWNADRPCGTGLVMLGRLPPPLGEWQICAAITSLTTIR